MRHSRSWSLWLFAGAAGLALVIAACASEAPGTGPGAGTGGASSAAGGSSPGAPTTPTGELRVNLGGEPKTIDPNIANFSTEITVIRQLFAGLIRFDEQGNPVADLAKEVPSASNGGVSADGKRYTFKLKDGLKWSDGKPLTADDFVYSIKRMLHPKTAAEYASFYYDIKGAQALNESKQTDEATLARLMDGVGVKATDASTLVIELERPRLTMVQLMGLWPAYPLRKDVIDKHGEKWTEAGNLIGNGPFVLSEWVHQDRITLTPNPNYHGEKAKLAKITLTMVTDTNANFAAYKAGERDMTDVPSASIRQVLADPTVKDEIVRFTDLATFGYQFNLRVPPFDNLKVRQALTKAVNRNAFVERLNFGVGKPAVSWIPPGMPGYDPESGKAVHTYDPEAARKLLAEAGYPDGRGLPSITMRYANNTANQQRAEFFQGQLKENLNIEVKLEPMEPASFSKAVNANDFQVVFLGWGADYPDPDNWLPDIFGSKGSQNHTGYSNPKFDELVARAMAEPDDKKRLALWLEAQKLVVEETPMVFLVHRERLWLKKPYVKDLITTGNDGSVPGSNFFYKLWVDKK